MKVTESQARKWLRALAWGAMKSQAIAREGAGSVRPETLESLGITNQKEADGIARSVDMTDKHNPLNPLTVANIFRRAEDHMPEAITIAYGQDTTIPLDIDTLTSIMLEKKQHGWDEEK